MDGLLPLSYAISKGTAGKQIDFQFHLFASGVEVAGYTFRSLSVGAFHSDHEEGYLKALTSEPTPLDASNLPPHENDAKLYVVQDMDATWGVPRYRLGLRLAGLFAFEGQVDVPSGTWPFALDGTWNQRF